MKQPARKQATGCAAMALCLLLVLSGCTHREPAISVSRDAPEQTLQTAMEAIKSLDIQTLNACTDNLKDQTTYTLLGDLQRKAGESARSREFLQAVIENLSWQIGEAAIHGATAEIPVHIENHDLTSVAGSFELGVLNAMFSGGDQPDLTKLVRACTETCAFDLTLTAKLETDGWRIQIDDAFANAVYGNLLEGTEHIPAELQSQIDAATDAVEQRAEDWAADFSSMFE